MLLLEAFIYCNFRLALIQRVVSARLWYNRTATHCCEVRRLCTVSASMLATGTVIRKAKQWICVYDC